jgi:hypothetical protein
MPLQKVPQGKDPDKMEMVVVWSFPGKRAVTIGRRFLGCCLAEETGKFVR